VKAWFARLEPRERWILSAGAVLAAIIVLWGFVWVPLGNGSAELRERIDDKQALLADLQRAAALGGGTSRGQRPAPTQSLVVLVDQTARTHGLADSFTRTRPDGADAINVSFQNAPFDGILAWLVRLNTDYGIRVESASFNGSRERGLVTGQLFLRRS
jgi:general secretion pathway protein M